MDKQRISESVLIKEFTLAIIKTVASRKFKINERVIINSSLIPQFSEKVNSRLMGKNIISPDLDIIPIPIQDLSNVPLPPIELKKQLSFSAPKSYMINIGEYGKITPLLKEDSITVIECDGAGKEILIVRANQKLSTKIMLNSEEIKAILNLISRKSRIPLTDGVFKAQVDNFELNAVVSEVIGTRFIIRKQTPYNLIEKKQENTIKTI
jgi:hypothetical protein